MRFLNGCFNAFHAGMRAVLAAAAIAALATGTAAHAGDYPDHPIRLIVGFPAGQSTDTAARRIAQGMSEILGQSVFIDNRPGAAGAISHQAVKNAPADGYTLLMGSTGTLSINPYLFSKLPYDPARDFDPISLVSYSPLVMFVPANSPFHDLQELVAYAKAHPGKLSYGSGGNGSTGQIAMEMLKKQAGIDLVHVPYKGSPPMVTGVIAGETDVAFETYGGVMAFADSGRLRLLGMATLKRFPGAPAVPTLAEQSMPGFEAVPWAGMLARKGTPPAVIAKLNAALRKVLADPAMFKEFDITGSRVITSTPEEMGRYMAQESARWGPAVKASGAQVD